ncbi:MAG: hypothetical protein ABIB47_05820 [Candidatus Woesearchaeota archaeon]
MFNLSYKEIISRIQEEKQLSEEEIQLKIKEKLVQLSDLISKEGAAHIVANELGVKILDVSKEVKINRLLTGMNGVSLLGKVVQVNDVVNFKKNDREGKVVSILFGDDTGVVRVVFWDTNHIKDVEDGKIKEDTILKITNAYVKSNNAYKEVHLGNRAELELNPSGVEVEVKNERSYDFEKKKISELQMGDVGVGVVGTIVQVFEPRFYEACPRCGKKLEAVGDSASCKEHGKVEQELVPIVNVFIDDGSENIRAVAFRNHAESLLNLNKDELLKARDNLEEFNKIRDGLLGRQLILVGRVIRNEFFDRNEMMVQRVIDVNPDELVKEVEKVS